MKKRFGIILACVMSFAIVISGCGSSSDGTTEFALGKNAAPEEAGGVYDNAAAEVAEESADYSGGAQEQAQTVNDTSRKLITTVNISAESENLDDTISKLTSKVTELGGYIENSNVYNGSRHSSGQTVRRADYTVRIPADKLDGFIETIENASNITSKSSNVEDVTLSYVDLESKKNALRAEEKSLLGILESAEKIEDILAVQEKLADVRYQLESIESQLRTYDNKVDYSTVYLNIEEVVTYTPTEEKGAFARMGEGFVKSLKSIGHGFKEFFIWFVIHIPQLVLLGIVVFVIVFIVKKSQKKSAAKREAFMKQIGVPVNTPPVNTTNEKPEGKDGQ